MSTTTTNYKLVKPALTDAPPDITVMNPNWDTIDTQLKNLNDSITNKPSITVDSALSGTSTNPVQNKVVKGALDGKLSRSGGTVTGTLVLSKVAEADGDSYNSPALVVGGESTTYHLEFDNNEIQAKQNETTPGNLFLNSHGGKVTVGEGGLENGGDFLPTKALNSNMGTSTLPWNHIYGRYLDLCGASDALYGRFRVTTTGTEATDGVTTLVLGNETASGTANNASGKITMYDKGTGFTNILPKTTTSGSNTVYLPTGSGTLLLDTQGAKIKTGSYTGTGTSGSTNPCTLTFDFAPKLVVIMHSEFDSSSESSMIAVYGAPKALRLGYSNTVQPASTLTWSGTGLSWYESDSKYQCNGSGQKYYYVAIG